MPRRIPCTCALAACTALCAAEVLSSATARGAAPAHTKHCTMAHGNPSVLCAPTRACCAHALCCTSCAVPPCLARLGLLSRGRLRHGLDRGLALPFGRR
ncbi:hypothetical protein OAO87_04175, partial [bacterium]|nr:hypothetical protein [bacterium]